MGFDFSSVLMSLDHVTGFVSGATPASECFTGVHKLLFRFFGLFFSPSNESLLTRALGQGDQRACQCVPLVCQLILTVFLTVFIFLTVTV